jgi:hypothetical protein
VEHWKSGPKKGQEKVSVTLEVGTYLYRKKREAKVDSGLMSFWCTLCEYLGVSSIAHVRKHQNGTTFTLESYDQDHQCVPSTVQQLVFRFKKQLYQEVEYNPLKSVNLIYQETRSEFTDKLD